MNQLPLCLPSLLGGSLLLSMFSSSQNFSSSTCISSLIPLLLTWSRTQESTKRDTRESIEKQLKTSISNVEMLISMLLPDGVTSLNCTDLPFLKLRKKINMPGKSITCTIILNFLQSTLLRRTLSTLGRKKCTTKSNLKFSLTERKLLAVRMQLF